MFQESVEDVGDLYLDLAEAYMDQKCFVDAKPILKKLVYSQNYNLVFLTVLLKNMCQLHGLICCKGYNFIHKHSNSRNTLM